MTEIPDDWNEISEKNKQLINKPEKLTRKNPPETKKEKLQNISPTIDEDLLKIKKAIENYKFWLKKYYTYKQKKGDIFSSFIANTIFKFLYEQAEKNLKKTNQEFNEKYPAPNPLP